MTIPVEQYHDFAWFAPNIIRIADKPTSEHIPFTANRTQQRIRDAITRADREGRPARIIVPKARQLGVSTVTQATAFHRAATRRNYRCTTVSHEDESAKTLHSMVETMYAQWPAAYAPLRPAKITKEMGKRLWFTHGSRLTVATAGGDADVGRSTANRLLHLSEAAHYPDLRKTLVSILASVPSEPGTLVLIESSPNGIDNDFYRRCDAARRAASEWELVFAPWFDDATARRATPPLEDLDAEELALRDRFGVTDEQLAWRRAKLRDDFDSDLEMFHQEHAATLDEAFVASGNGFFAPSLLAAFVPDEPVRVGRLSGEFALRGRVGFERHEHGPLRVFDAPDKDTRYLAFVDPAGLVTPDEERSFVDRRDARDYTAVTVLDCKTGRRAATWRARIDADLAAVEVAKLGVVYNTAAVCVEMTGGYGTTMVSKLRDLGYPNLHRSVAYDAKTRTRHKRFGWATTKATRPMMLDALTAVLRDHPDWLRDEELKAEMRSFINRTGKPQAAPGTHDDLVMSTAGAYTILPDYAQARITLPATQSLIAA